MRDAGLEGRITFTLVAVLGVGNATVRNRFPSTQLLGHLTGGDEERIRIGEILATRVR
jgi:hypothetical protein